MWSLNFLKQSRLLLNSRQTNIENDRIYFPPFLLLFPPSKTGDDALTYGKWMRFYRQLNDSHKTFDYWKCWSLFCAQFLDKKKIHVVQYLNLKKRPRFQDSRISCSLITEKKHICINDLYGSAWSIFPQLYNSGLRIS